MRGATMERNPDAKTGTVGKALALLDVVAASPEPLRFTEILAACNQPRGTLHRQLRHLVDEGLLEVNRDQTYSLGLRLLRLASRSWADNQFRSIAAPHLKTLHELTFETVHLGVLNGPEVIYLDKVESKKTVRMYSQIGNASPVYCTGVGKAALSTLPDEKLEALLAQIEFRRFTEHTLTRREAVMAEIREIRETGNAWDREEHEIGIHCVAAPVCSSDGSISAGISVTGPAYRLSQEQLREWAGPVREAAAAIMQDMEIRLSPRA